METKCKSQQVVFIIGVGQLVLATLLSCLYFEHVRGMIPFRSSTTLEDTRDYCYVKIRETLLGSFAWRTLDRILLAISARRLAFLLLLALLAWLAVLLICRTKMPRLMVVLVITPLIAWSGSVVYQCYAYIFTKGPVIVNWTSPLQMIDGFGAASGGNVPKLTPAQMDFFYTRAGIHLKFIRVQVYPDAAECNTDQDSLNCVSVGSGAAVSAGDLANAQAAVTRGALVWASEWSPPASMKSNRRFFSGGAMENGENNANFTALAAIQTSFVDLMTGTYGIPIYAISVQNEPDASMRYPSCTWTPRQIHDYVSYLAAALAAAGYRSTKIMIAEPGAWENTYATSAMNDPKVASDIGILAAHAYNGKVSSLSYNNITDQHQWQTEVSDFNVYDASIASGLTYATMLHNWLTIARVNSWQYWLLSGQDGFSDNEGLAGPGGRIAKRAYTFGNFSKSVQFGWSVVEVTNNTTLLVSAYKSPVNGAAIVVVNNGWAVHNQVFSVGTEMGSSVTPWVTSASLNLAPQPPVAVFSGSFRYTIPASSGVTVSSSVTEP